MTANPKKSGNPATRAKATAVSAWKKSTRLTPILLPSGNYMSFKRVGMEVFLTSGMMPNSLMGFAQRAVEKGRAQGMTTDEISDLMSDTDKIAELVTFIDKAICFVSVEPKVHPVPLDDEGEVDESQRSDELLYVDEVGLEDKMFIWQLVAGGTTNVESFRTESAAVLASVHRGEDLELPAE